MRLKKRRCKKCGREFQATPGQQYCDDCRYKKCLVCGKRFLIKPGVKKVSKYCSRKCWAEARRGTKLSLETRKRMTQSQLRRKKSGKFIKCEWCGKEVYKYPRDIKRVKHYFCSIRCAALYHQGKHFSPKTEFRVGQFAGKNSLNWKGGITSLYRRVKYSNKGKKWVLSVFKRDGYICQKCGKASKGDLEAHHIKSFSLIFIENGIESYEQAMECQELWDTDNGITFCEKCHKEFHHQNYRELRSQLKKARLKWDK